VTRGAIVEFRAREAEAATLNVCVYELDTLLASSGTPPQIEWDRHRQLNRHHLQQADGVRDDVNLIDVLDFIADCVMAGMARSGSVYPLQLSPELLERAFQNTVTLLKANVAVEQPETAGEAQDATK